MLYGMVPGMYGIVVVVQRDVIQLVAVAAENDAEYM